MSVESVENELALGQFPALKHVVHNSHASINGTVKLKHFTVYAKPSLNTNSLPAITEDSKCIQLFTSTGKAKAFI